MDFNFDDFTESEYQELLKIAKGNWEIAAFSQYKKSGRICLWRHDVDLSVHRAYRLAAIEAKEGVKTTYFINLHSKFYHFLEEDISRLIFAILDFGHDMGLHFDSSFYNSRFVDNEDLLEVIEFEKHILTKLFRTEIIAVSLHNPDVCRFALDHDEIHGMINANGKYIRENFSYCSDSNGYWRFRRLRDVLEAAEEEKLHILTHPEWWTPEPMSPRERISRCIDGRAAGRHRSYDEFIGKTGRKNVK